MFQLISQFGGPAALVVALVVWMGRVKDQRIARNEKAELDRQLEILRHQLSLIGDERMDALNRRRDVYSRLATALRVFVDSNKHPDEKEKKEFLKAYDEGCLWASEAVIQALGKLIDIMQLNSKAKGMVSQSDMRAAYTECVLAMRKDSGFPDSNFEYRFVTFQ